MREERRYPDIRIVVSSAITMIFGIVLLKWALSQSGLLHYLFCLGLIIIISTIFIFLWKSLDGTKEMLPYFTFLILGIIFLLIAYIIGNKDKYEFSSDISFNLGIVTLAVTLLAALWRFVGGNPLLESIKRLQTSTALLSDLENSGIKRIFAERRKASSSADEFLQLESAKKIDIMGHILRENLVRNDKLLDELQKRTEDRLLEFRAILLNPTDENIFLQQSIDEAKWSKDPIERKKAQEASLNRMRAELEYSLYELSEKRKFNVKVADKSFMYINMIRADNKIIVTKYLLSVRGGSCPTIFVEGEDTPFFEIFSKEFEAMWERGSEWHKPKGEEKEVTKDE